MRYYFHVRESGGGAVDEEGLELDGAADARSTAITGARSIIASEALAGRLMLDGSIEVDDANGARVLVLPFREAVSVDLGAAD